jgi:membrane protein DedA with SNARE-associated domain
MPWRRFMLWNAAGAIAWCASLGTLAAVVGPAGAATVSGIGLVAAGGGAVMAATRALAARRRAAEPEPALVSAA